MGVSDGFPDGVPLMVSPLHPLSLTLYFNSFLNFPPIIPLPKTGKERKRKKFARQEAKNDAVDTQIQDRQGLRGRH